MLKKLLVTSAAILAVSSTAALANGVPYVGAGLGIKNTSGQRFMPINVFAGYGEIVSPGLYLGGELNADLASVNLNDSNTFKTTYGLGVSVIPGMMLSDSTMLYGRLGVVRSNFNKYSSNLVNGGQLGLGVQTRLTQNVDLRGEYVYTKYQSFSRTVSGTRVGVTSLASDQVNLGLVYKFA